MTPPAGAKILHDGWKRAGISGELRWTLYRSGPDQSYDGLRAAAFAPRVPSASSTDLSLFEDIVCAENPGVSDRNVWTRRPASSKNG